MDSANEFLQSLLCKFKGCDGGDPGSVTEPSIWLFGIEHGWSKADQNGKGQTEPDETYSVETQLKIRFNQSAFKLLAEIEGQSAREYRDFAGKRKPFVKGFEGYFKGNLYPVACHNVGVWTEEDKSLTGFARKAQFRDWCAKHRWPVIKDWIDEYCPKLFIGVGTTQRSHFCSSVFGSERPFEEYNFDVNGYKKTIYFINAEGRKLVVVPHFAGPNGLNSYESIEKAGQFIREFLSCGNYCA